MTPHIYFPFVFFVVVMTGTPGVGNLTMMSIGQATGFRSALPFLTGTTVGMVALNVLVSFGLGTVFETSQTVAMSMKAIGMGYILYLAYKLLHLELATVSADKRFTFIEGVFVHPLNPKSWAMSVVGFSMLASPGGDFTTHMASFVLTFLVFQVSCHALWGWAGSAMLRSLRSQVVRRVVNLGLVTTMVGATAYALFL